jgi:hypothetical protein
MALCTGTVSPRAWSTCTSTERPPGCSGVAPECSGGDAGLLGGADTMLGHASPSYRASQHLPRRAFGEPPVPSSGFYREPCRRLWFTAYPRVVQQFQKFSASIGGYPAVQGRGAPLLTPHLLSTLPLSLKEGAKPPTKRAEAARLSSPKTSLCPFKRRRVGSSTCSVLAAVKDRARTTRLLDRSM